MVVDIPQNILLSEIQCCTTKRHVMLMPLFFSHILLFISEVHVDEETGMKRYPFELRTVPRLHWEDPTADHLMTHEVSNQSLLVFVGLQINSLGTSDLTVCESQPPHPLCETSKSSVRYKY